MTLAGTLEVQVSGASVEQAALPSCNPKYLTHLTRNSRTQWDDAVVYSSCNFSAFFLPRGYSYVRLRDIF